MVDLRGTLHVQRFVRAFVVEDLDEVIELGLLLQEIQTRWFSRFFFQGQMHALMTAVLLGMARLDPFDAEPEPPDRQFGQITQGLGGSEGTSLSLRMLAGRSRFLQSLSNTTPLLSRAGGFMDSRISECGTELASKKARFPLLRGATLHACVCHGSATSRICSSLRIR
ncbi:MAG: hypothetical protein WCC21_15170 [Candidatus Acidiferrales bacterium]